MNLNNMGIGRQLLQTVLSQGKTKQWSKTQQELSQTSTKNTVKNNERPGIQE